MLAAAVLPAAAAGARATPPLRPGIILAGFQPTTSAVQRRALERAVGATGAQPLGLAARATPAGRRLGRRFGLAFALSVRPGRETADVGWLRRQSALVRYAEPDYLLEASATQRLPNDPSFSLQWGPQNTGQTINGVTGSPGADDSAASAWAVTTGSPSIVIAEVDSGVDYNHPDLAANIWSNPGGVGGCAAGTHGYNVLTSTPSAACDPMDNDTVYGGHGTHVAGIIGAIGNNGAGVAGMNWSTTILPVKWLDSKGNGTTAQLIRALDWVATAKDAGVDIKVVNDSATFVGTAYSQALSDEIDLLGADGILYVTAAGNSSQDNDDPSTARYPCDYDRPTEICVTASDQNDQRPSWANWGVNTVDLAAPGDNIYSTLRVARGSYGYISGGSMAAAQVSGAAGLILSASDMAPTALKADILDNVDPIPSLAGKVRTGGRLDVCKALAGCEPPVNEGAPSVSGSAVVGQMLSADDGSWSPGATSFAYQWQRCDSSGGSCTDIAGASAPTYEVASGDQGSTLRVGVVALDPGGSSAPAYSQATGVVVAPAPAHSPPAPATPPPPVTALLARAFAATPRRIAVSIEGTRQSTKGTRFSFWLNESASVQIVIERRVAGRRVRGRCVAAARAPAHATACTLYVKLTTIAIRNARAGTNSTAWGGRIGKRPLAPGRYRALMVARRGGETSRTQTTSFVVVDIFATPRRPASPETLAATRGASAPG